MKYWYALFAICLLPVTLIAEVGDQVCVIDNHGPVDASQAISRALNDIEVFEGELVLTHPGHEARFTSTGIEFLPKRGPAWTWQLTNVTSTGIVRSIANIHPAVPGRSTWRTVTYDRGGIVECYVARRHAIEQRFVLETKLDLNGADLVIEGRIDSDGLFEQGGGWFWTDEQGRVSLGDVTVFDAEGTVLPATMDVTATSTRITVDGAALAEATYPVIVDPEIGTNDFRISDVGPDTDPSYSAQEPAVAYNANDNEYLVIWHSDETGSDNESEIYGQRINALTGAEVGSNDFRISDMGDDGDPNFDAFNSWVAWNSINNEYLVVWSGDDTTNGLSDNELEIYGQRLDGSTGSEVGSNDFRISDMGGNGDGNFDAGFPRVAHNATDNDYLVVWQADDTTGTLVDNENEIWGQRIAGTTGAEVGTNDFRISDMGPDGDANYDAVSASVEWNSTNNEYLVVWQGDDNTAPNVDGAFEIFGQRLAGATGAEVGTNDFRISDMGTSDANTSFGVGRSAIAYNSTNNEYLVIWQGDDDTGSLIDNEVEIYGQRIDGATGGEVGNNDFRLSDVGTDGDGDRDAASPNVTWNSTENEYFVVWHADDDGESLLDNEFEVFGQQVWGDRTTGDQKGTNDILLSDIGPAGDGRFDVSGFSKGVAFNSTNNEYLTVWPADDSTNAQGADIIDQEFEIFGQRFDASAPLPVELVRFEAVVDGEAVRLVWETATETDNAGFDVEHRAGTHSVWRSLGFQNGAGTTSLRRTYAFRAEVSEPGLHHFRLRQVDYDGAFEYSPIVEVSIELADRYHLSPVYPNPFNPEARFTLTVAEPQEVSVTLHDVLGREVKTLLSERLEGNKTHQIRLDGTGLSGGIYLVQVRGESFETSRSVTLLK